jgi:RNA polymerase sigma factor (sigma-70 family)
MAARLKPDGGRSRLFSRRPRVGTDAALHRHAVPRTDVTVLDRRLPLRLAKRSPRRRELGRCPNSSMSGAESATTDAAPHLGEAVDTPAIGDLEDQAERGGSEHELFGLSRRCRGMESLLSDARILSDSVSEPAMFSSLYERHLRAVASYVARRTGPELSEDLTAEVFVRAFRNRAVFRDDHGSALPWLLGIANNLIADHRRAERRRLEMLRRLAMTRPVSSETGVGVLAPKLVGELLRLPAADRDTLLLVVWGELTYAEAATALSVPIGTVRSRIARARQRLGAAIGQPADGEAPIVNGESHA